MYLTKVDCNPQLSSMQPISWPPAEGQLSHTPSTVSQVARPHSEAVIVPSKGAMTRYQTTAGTLAPALVHFRKVTHSYWPGLFACYTVPALPRTNNALEQFFGAYRYHNRRATGRKAASPALVLSGSVGILAAAATRLRTYSAAELVPENVSAWQALRQARETRRQQRTLRRRFRRDPASYLAQLQAALLQLILPP